MEVILIVTGAVIAVGLVLILARRLTRKPGQATKLERELALALLMDGIGRAEQRDSTKGAA